jgi:hypothetical protein
MADPLQATYFLDLECNSLTRILASSPLVPGTRYPWTRRSCCLRIGALDSDLTYDPRATNFNASIGMLTDAWMTTCNSPSTAFSSTTE